MFDDIVLPILAMPFQIIACIPLRSSSLLLQHLGKLDRSVLRDRRKWVGGSWRYIFQQKLQSDCGGAIQTHIRCQLSAISGFRAIVIF